MRTGTFEEAIKKARKMYDLKKCETTPLLAIECIGYLKALQTLFPEIKEISELIETYKLLVMVATLE